MTRMMLGPGDRGPGNDDSRGCLFEGGCGCDSPTLLDPECGPFTSHRYVYVVRSRPQPGRLSDHLRMSAGAKQSEYRSVVTILEQVLWNIEESCITESDPEPKVLRPCRAIQG